MSPNNNAAYKTYDGEGQPPGKNIAIHHDDSSIQKSLGGVPSITDPTTQYLKESVERLFENLNPRLYYLRIARNLKVKLLPWKYAVVSIHMLNDNDK
jgi:hypothetical protein